MNEDNIFTAYVIIALTVVLFVLIFMFQSMKSCENKGGTYLIRDNVCISNQFIIK